MKWNLFNSRFILRVINDIFPKEHQVAYYIKNYQGNGYYTTFHKSDADIFNYWDAKFVSEQIKTSRTKLEKL